MPDVISLPQLLEASIGTPELGAVNFNLLHKLLLEIINRLDLAGHAVPVSDIDSKKDAKAAAVVGYQKSSYNALSEKVGKIERELNHMSTTLPDSKDMISKVKTIFHFNHSFLISPQRRVLAIIRNLIIELF